MITQHVFTFTYDSITVSIPYYEICGSQDGPHIVITGGMHGNEINGISTVHRLIEEFTSLQVEKKLRGKITVIPILNPTGFSRMQRECAIDNLDTNRCFGIEKNKHFSHYRADAIIHKFYESATHGIDIHDAGGRSILIPHARIHSCDAPECQRCTYEMAKLLNTQIVLIRDGEEGMLSVFCNKVLQIPVLTIEVGGSQITLEHYYKDIYTGIINILTFYNFLPGTPIYSSTPQSFLHTREYATAKSGGEIYLHTELGSYVHKGEQLGTIRYHSLGIKEDILALNDGFVFSKRTANQIPVGANMYSLISK